VLAIALPLMSGCFGKPEAAPPEAAPPEAAPPVVEPKVLKFGLIGPLTGSWAVIGLPYYRSLELGLIRSMRKAELRSAARPTCSRRMATTTKDTYPQRR